MDREYIAWDSPTLGRRMEMLWFGHAGKPMIWFPTSAGRFYQNEDFGLVGAIGDLVENGVIQICCVDSVDSESFYAKSLHPSMRIRRHDQYDHYLANEVVPFVRSKARTGSRVATLGASFGAYHGRVEPPTGSEESPRQGGLAVPWAGRQIRRRPAMRG